MARWERVTLRSDDDAGEQTDVGPAEDFVDGDELWAVVSMASAEMKQVQGFKITDRIYHLRFRGTPSLSVRSTEIKLSDRNGELLRPVTPSANPDGYGRDTVIWARDTGETDA